MLLMASCKAATLFACCVILLASFQRTAAASCTLTIHGNGDKPGIRLAGLSCSNGAVNVAANRTLLRPFVDSFRGIDWSKNGCSIPSHWCLLTFCERAQVILTHATVVDVAERGLWAGVLCVVGEAQVQLQHGNVSGNKVTALYVSQGATVRISNTTFSRNVNAKNAGGALFVDGHGRVLINSSRFHSNHATGGAALATLKQGSVVIKASTFTNNTAQWGAVFRTDSTSVVDVDGSLLRNNAADYQGGVLAAQGQSQVSFTSCTLANNTAHRAAGGALHASNAAQISIRRCSLLQNSAAGAGGALFVGDEGAATVSASNITGNDAKTVGGAVAVTGQAEVYGTGLHVHGNAAVRYGGAFHVDEDSLLNLTDSTLADNSARHHMGGALAASGSAQVLLDGVLLTNNSAEAGGAVLLEDSTRLIATGTHFTHNRARSQSGGAVLATTQAVAKFVACSMTNNTAASDGGAVDADSGATIILQDSTVAHNMAETSGGGINVRGAAHIRLDPETHILRNSAAWGGGISLHSQQFHATEVQRAATDNAATYSNNVAVPVTDMMLLGQRAVTLTSRLENDEGWLGVQLNVTGLQGLPCHVHVQALLAGKQVLVNTTQPNGLATLRYKPKLTPGTYELTFSILGASGSGSSSGSSAVSSSQRLANATLRLVVMPCRFGDVVTSAGDACLKCPAGYYSVDPASTNCQLCALGATCPGGGAILPEPGWWHSSPRSKQMHPCRQPTACVGNSPNVLPTLPPEAYKAAQCAEGYTSNLCAACAPGYGRVRAFSCRKCLHMPSTVAVYILAGVALLLFIKLVCNASSTHAAMPAANVPVAPLAPLELLKPFVLYTQYTLIVTSLPGVHWPLSLTYPLQLLAWWFSPTVPSTLLSKDCLLSAHSSLSIGVQRLLFSLLVPIVMLVALLLLDAAIASCSHGNRRLPVMQTLLVVLFFFLPSLIRTAFSVYQCIPVDQAEPEGSPFVVRAVGRFWVGDMRQQCYQGWHQGWALGMLFLALLLCVALPVGLAWFLMRHRAVLETDQNLLRRFGFLYKCYKPSYCYWEAVVVIEMALVVAAAVFGLLLPTLYAALLVNAVVGAVLVLQLMVQPYRHSTAERYAMYGMCCVFFTSYVAVSLTASVIEHDERYGLVVGCLVLAVHVAYIAALLKQLHSIINWGGLRQKLTHAAGTCMLAAHHKCSMPACSCSCLCRDGASYAGQQLPPGLCQQSMASGTSQPGSPIKRLLSLQSVASLDWMKALSCTKMLHPHQPSGPHSNV